MYLERLLHKLFKNSKVITNFRVSGYQVDHLTQYMSISLVILLYNESITQNLGQTSNNMNFLINFNE